MALFVDLNHLIVFEFELVVNLCGNLQSSSSKKLIKTTKGRKLDIQKDLILYFLFYITFVSNQKILNKTWNLNTASEVRGTAERAWKILDFIMTFNLSLKNPTCFISFINVVSIFSRKWNSHNEGLGQSGSLSTATLQTGPGLGSYSLVFQ